MRNIRKDATALFSVFFIVLAIIGVNPFRQTLAPMDLLLSFPGWQNADVKTPLISNQRSDAIDHRLPNWRFFREQIRSGHLPTWNPLNQLGAPGIQAPIYEGLSLPFFVFAAMPNEAVGYTLAIILNFMIAAFGTYALIYFMFRRRAAAVFGAVTYAFCGFNIAWAHWPHLTTSALIPWILAAELRYWQTGKIRWLPTFSLSITLLGLAGFPFVAEWGVIAAALLGATLIVSNLRDEGLSKKIILQTSSLFFAGLAGLLIALPGIFQVLHILNVTDISYRVGGTLLAASDIINLLGFDFKNHLGVERTFSPGTIAVILSVIGFALVLIRPRRYGVFAALIGCFSIIVTYGIANPDLVRMIPGFGYNHWSRSGIAVDLSIALLAAYAITWLLRAKRQKIAYGSLTIIFAATLLQLHLNFSALNAKPALDTYFPDTPTIDFAKHDLKPLQSVVAGSTFLVSGTLTNYGLPEFFAHDFHTDAQRAGLEDISPTYATTRTASLLDCHKINYGSPFLDYAAVRQILAGDNCQFDRLQPISGSGQRPSLPLNKGKLKGSFELSSEVDVVSASFLFATYRNPTAPAPVRLRIFYDGEDVVDTTIPADAVHDNRFATFDFAKSAHFSSGKYEYELSLVGKAGPSKLSVWTYAESKGKSYTVGTASFKGAPKFHLNVTESFPSDMKVREVENGTLTIVNEAVSGSAYFIHALDGFPTPDFSLVSLISYDPKNIVLRYVGHDDGWVVVPIRADRYWNVVVAGQSADMQLFKGIFPAVHVRGPTGLKFYYDDSGIISQFVYFSAGGVLVMFLSMGIAAYNSRRSVHSD